MSLGQLALPDNQVRMEFVVKQVPLDRKETVDKMGQMELQDSLARQALRALLEFRDGLDRRETAVEMESLEVQATSVFQEAQECVVRRVSRVPPVPRVAREIVVLQVQTAWLEALETLDRQDQEDLQESREALDLLDKLDHLDHEVCVQYNVAHVVVDWKISFVSGIGTNTELN